MGKHNRKKWAGYYALQGERLPANPLLRRVLGYVGHDARAPGHAIDLGCGQGHDTCALLRRGFTVHAIDAQPQALRLLKRRVPKTRRARLQTTAAYFEKLTRAQLEPAAIVNASMSLFFCNRSSFDRLWRRVADAVQPGGYFCGHFIGPRDTWAKKRGLTAVSERKLRRMLADFKILRFEEHEDDLGTLTGMPKHWHTFSVIARKRR